MSNNTNNNLPVRVAVILAIVVAVIGCVGTIFTGLGVWVLDAYQKGRQAQFVSPTATSFLPPPTAVSTLVAKTPASTLSQPTVAPAGPTAPRPQSPTQIPAAPTPKSLGTLRIFGNSNKGVQITIPTTGVYRFEYRGGAYTVDPTIRARPDPWLTAIFIYKGNKPLWDGERIKDESLFLRLADNSYFKTEAEAANAAQQNGSIEAELSAGETLTLVAVDAQSAYADNQGQVIIEWFFLGP